jgi:cytidylate kinase
LQHLSGGSALIEAIAIDGPVASGKSAVGSRVAACLDYAFLDTGIMYRAVAWLVRERGIDPADRERVVDLLRSATITVEPARPAQRRSERIFIDGRDVTDRLRTPEVEAAVSAVASIPAVREHLIAMQRALAEAGPIVMVGRDIGSVVIPDAQTKIFLDASPETRAQRRWKERLGRGEQVDYQTVRDEMQRRDALDNRTTPLAPAPGAYRIQTDNLSLDAVAEAIVKRVACHS